MDFKAMSAVLCAPLLAGCQQDVAVRVDQDATGVTFTLASDRTSPPCLGWLEISPTQPESAPPLWRISNGKASEPCVTTLRYGDSPPGFGRSPPAPPLVAGRSYRVSVSGNAFIGQATFVRR